jgi:hypothetical protein
MSAPSSPGRTWSIILVECELPVLAGAIATGILGYCGRIAPVPGLGSATEAPVSPNLGSQGHFRRQPGPERGRHRNLDRSLFPLSVAPRSASGRTVNVPHSLRGHSARPERCRGERSGGPALMQSFSAGAKNLLFRVQACLARFLEHTHCENAVEWAQL